MRRRVTALSTSSRSFLSDIGPLMRLPMELKCLYIWQSDHHRKSLCTFGDLSANSRTVPSVHTGNGDTEAYHDSDIAIAISWSARGVAFFLPTSHCFGTRKLTRLSRTNNISSYLAQEMPRQTTFFVAFSFHHVGIYRKDLSQQGNGFFAPVSKTFKRTITRPNDKGKSLGLIPFQEMPKVRLLAMNYTRGERPSIS